MAIVVQIDASVIRREYLEMTPEQRLAEWKRLGEEFEAYAGMDGNEVEDAFALLDVQKETTVRMNVLRQLILVDEYERKGENMVPVVPSL